MTSRNALCSLQGPFPSLRHRRRRIHQKYNHPTSPWGSIRAGSRCWCTRCSWRCRGRRGVSRRFPSPLPDVSRCRSLSPSASTTIPFRFLANVRRAGGIFRTWLLLSPCRITKPFAAAADEFACVNAAAVERGLCCFIAAMATGHCNSRFASVERQDSEQEDEDEEGE